MSAQLPQIGDVLDGYTLTGLVPSTRRGRNPVFLGEAGAQRVALKFLLVDARSKSAVENEIMMQCSLSHQYIIEYVADFAHDPYHVLVLEFAPCGSVESYRRSRHLTALGEHHAKLVLSQMLDALRYMHGGGYVHGDVKPHNFLLMNADLCRPVAKLADFGSARRNDGVPITSAYPGTQQFRAPEVIRAAPAGWTSKADMWSLGMAMHFMLTGRFPPRIDGKRAIAADPRLDPAAWADMPVAQALVRDLLRVNPDARLSAEQALGHSWFQDVAVGCAGLAGIGAPVALDEYLDPGQET
jgi:serine/threonine protein kinase